MDCRKHKSISLLAIGLIVICLLVTVGCRKKTEPASPSAVPTTAVSEANSAAANPDDEKTIRQLANEFTAAFRLDNPTPITRLEEIFADNFCQRTMDGNTIQGKQDNLSFYRSRQEKNRAVLQSRAVYYDIQSVTMSRDLAVVFGEIKGERWFKNAPKPYMANFWETLVFQKINGKWYLVQEQSTKPRPAKEQPAQQEKTGEPTPSSPNDTPKTQSLSAEQTKNLDEYIRGSFSGIGVGFNTHPNGIYIKNVIPGGPADNAGLKNGEIITAINGESTVGISLERAVSLIKGPENTSVNLKVLLSNGTNRDVSVVRRTVIAAGVENRILEPNIGLLVISGFNQETTAKVRDALMYFQQQKINGIVLDLRDNKGGLLPAVKEIAGMFTGPNQIMWYVQYTGQANRVAEKSTVQKMAQWPVFVLINPETRCGGELLASAIRSGAGSELLGQKTFGEGSIYKLEKQADGTSQKIPTGYFFTADGQVIDGQGIKPDRELDPKLSSEEVLKQAVYELTRKIENRK